MSNKTGCPVCAIAKRSRFVPAARGSCTNDTTAVVLVFHCTALGLINKA